MQLREEPAMFGGDTGDKGSIYINTTEKLGKEHPAADGERWQFPQQLKQIFLRKHFVKTLLLTSLFFRIEDNIQEKNLCCI